MKIPFITTIALLTSAAVAQQPCHAEFDGPNFKDTVSMSGPNFTNCIKTKAANTMVVFAVEVFTGEKTGTSTVGVWNHDAVTDSPKAEQARGSFSMRTTNSWQGANLSQPVIIQKDETFWVSWIPVNGSQGSVEASGSTLPGIQTYKWSRNNAAPWNGPYKGHQWKFRLWCQPLVEDVVTIGKSCTDGFGNAGVYDAPTSPKLGNQAFSLTGNGLPPSAACVFAFGVQQKFPSLDLGFIGAPTCFLHTDIIVQVGGTTSAGIPAKSNGTVNLAAAIPNDPLLKGVYLRSQLFVADPNATRQLPVVFTNGLGLTVQ